MPEILIATIDPNYKVGNPNRVLKEERIIDLPDRSGRYAIPHPWRVELGSPIILDLSEVRYVPPRWGIPRTIPTIEGDVYGNNAPGEITYQKRISIKSWPVTLTRADIDYHPKHTNPGSGKDAALGLDGSRTMRMMRNGEARGELPMLPKDPEHPDLPRHRELVMRLKRPVISCHREKSGRWVQDHYYPDYPIMSGSIDRYGDRIDPEEDRYDWIDTLSAREIAKIGTVILRMPSTLRGRIQQRQSLLLEEAEKRWRDAHPYGNYI